ncbi:unnamed protein product [Caenorhabditis brenneri]
MFNRILFFAFLVFSAGFMVTETEAASNCVHKVLSTFKVICQDYTPHHYHVKAHECCQKSCSLEEMVSFCTN